MRAGRNIIFIKKHIVFLLVLCSVNLFAQVDETQILQELSEQGIDPTQIGAENISELENVLEKAVNEAEKEEQQDEQRVDEIIEEKAEEIEEAVREGESVEEAIAEEVLEDNVSRTTPTNIYGQHIFTKGNERMFELPTDIKAPDTYILGVGDEIAVNIWGDGEFSGTFKINKEGYISRERLISRIYLKGMPYGKARDLIKDRFGERYNLKKSDIEVSLNYSRVISINVVGEVNKFGSFSLPAMNTAFNALFAANGVTALGSVRRIQVMRVGGQSKTLDVYKYLKNPSSREEFYLQDNDYIFVPPVEKVVRIEGAIKRPFKYELLTGENLKELLEYANGFADNAYKSNLQLYRYENDEEVMIDIPWTQLSKSNRNYNLENGDRIRVKAIAKPIDNFAEISGAVDYPERYQLSSGMRVADIIEKAQLSKNARTDIAYLIRKKSNKTLDYVGINLEEVLKNPASINNVKLKSEDKLIIYSKSKFEDQNFVSVEGDVREPGQYSFYENMRLSDLLNISGGIKVSANSKAYIIRTDVPGTGHEYIPFNIEAVVNGQAQDENFLLQPRDKIVVYSKALFYDDAPIKVEGAVRRPGSFIYDESLTLSDALYMSGGLKLQAANSRIEISRLMIDGNKKTETVIAVMEVDDNLQLTSGSGFKLSPYDYIFVRSAPEFELQKIVRIKGEVKYSGSYSIIGDNERISNLIERAGGFTNEAFPEGAKLIRKKDTLGFVVIDLSEIMKNRKSRFNYILEEGDVISIPRQKELVTITGATNYDEVRSDVKVDKINTPFHANKNAKFYIDKYAGGVDRDKRGRNRLIYVEYPSGAIKKTRNFGLFKVYPRIKKGSNIVVKTKPKKERNKDGTGKNGSNVDWDSVLARTTSLVTLILLIQQVTR